MVDYSLKTKLSVQIVYIVAAVLWVLLVYYLGLVKAKYGIGNIILSLPLFLYGISFANVSKCNSKVEGDMFKGDIVAIGLLFISLFVQVKSTKDVKLMVYTLIAFALILLSIVDIWVAHTKQSVVKHIRSAFQTAAISLLLFVLYLYYLHYSKTTKSSNHNMDM